MRPLIGTLLWRLSRINGVTPLVYRTLSTICPAAVPSAIHDAFRRHLQANALLNTLLAKELVAVLDALAAKGVRAIPFKGVTLAQTAYGDLSLRECADLDLIVDQTSIPQARQVLWSQGYQLTGQDMGRGTSLMSRIISSRRRMALLPWIFNGLWPDAILAFDWIEAHSGTD